MAAALAAATAWADAKHPNPFLSQAKVFATQGEGDKCLKRLVQAERKWKFNDKKDRAEIEMYGGICGYLVGETQAAEVSFKKAVSIFPKIELPKDLGPGVEQLWAKATGKTAPVSSSPTAVAKKEEPKPRVAEAPPPPKKDEAPPPPIAPAAQKERKLTPDEELDQQISAEARASPPAEAKSRNFAVPVVLGVASVGAGLAGALIGLQAKSHEATFKSPDTYYDDAQLVGWQARREALVANILFGAAAALLVAAVVAFLVSG